MVVSKYRTDVLVVSLPLPLRRASSDLCSDWIRIARILDANRSKYDAFLVVHGTDTMAYTASALSLLLRWGG